MRHRERGRSQKIYLRTETLAEDLSEQSLEQRAELSFWLAGVFYFSKQDIGCLSACRGLWIQLASSGNLLFPQLAVGFRAKQLIFKVVPVNHTCLIILYDFTYVKCRKQANQQKVDLWFLRAKSEQSMRDLQGDN